MIKVVFNDSSIFIKYYFTNFKIIKIIDKIRNFKIQNKYRK